MTPSIDGSMTIPSLLDLLFLVAIVATELAIVAFYIVLAVIDRRQFKKRWKPGLVFGLVLFPMFIPGIVFGLAYFDDPNMPENMHGVVLAFAAVGAILFQVAKIGWHMVLYVVAASEWQRASPCGPLGGRARTPVSWGRLAGGFAFGAVAAVLTVAVFTAMGVKEGRMFADFQRMFPGVESASPLVVIPTVSLLVTALAISEELVYRGGMMALVVRKSRGRPMLRYLGVTVITFVWALAHAPNTDAPLMKMTQIFVIGIVLAEIARRDSLRTAIAAHVGLNLTAVPLAFLYT